MRSSFTRALLGTHDDRRESNQVYLTLAHHANQSVITDNHADREGSGGRTYVCQLPFAAGGVAIKRRNLFFAGLPQVAGEPSVRGLTHYRMSTPLTEGSRKLL